MTYKKNVIANYIGQAYVLIINIVSLPIIVKIMGPEAYGLVGFFTVVQSWFMLLDLGITPTICRQTANCLKEPEKLKKLRQQIRLMEVFFIFISMFGLSILIFFSDFITNKWLKVNKLNLDEVKYCILLMAILISFRWLTGLYKGVVTGFEQIVWLNKANSIISTFKFILIIPILEFYGSSPSVFFIYQLIIGITETVLYFFKVQRYLPKSSQFLPSNSVVLINEILGFSILISFTNIVWILITQSDKLLLSNNLSLTEFTYFTLATQLAYAPVLICNPITNALLPRLANIAAKKEMNTLSSTYRQGIQMVSVIATPIVLIIVLYPKQLLMVWCNDTLITNSVFFTLFLYAIGNWFMVLASFPYYLQFALGNLKLHFIGNCIFLFIYIPELIWATKKFGSNGAGYSWLFSNMIFFFVWVPIVHRFILNKYTIKYFYIDVFKPIFITFVLAILSRFLFDFYLFEIANRIYILVFLLVVFLMLILVSVLMLPFLRYALLNILNFKSI